MKMVVRHSLAVIGVIGVLVCALARTAEPYDGVQVTIDISRIMSPDGSGEVRVLLQNHLDSWGRYFSPEVEFHNRVQLEPEVSGRLLATGSVHLPPRGSVEVRASMDELAFVDWSREAKGLRWKDVLPKLRRGTWRVYGRVSDDRMPPNDEGSPPSDLRVFSQPSRIVDGRVIETSTIPDRPAE